MLICPVCKKPIDVTPYNPPRVLLHGEGDCIEKWKALPKKTKARLRVEVLGVPYMKPAPIREDIPGDPFIKIKLFGVRKIAILLMVDKDTVTRWIKKGKIPIKYRKQIEAIKKPL